MIYVVKNVVVVANECCLFNLLRFISCNYAFLYSPSLYSKLSIEGILYFQKGRYSVYILFYVIIVKSVFTFTVVILGKVVDGLLVMRKIEVLLSWLCSFVQFCEFA